MDYELLPLSRREGVGVCVFNPLAGELLTGLHQFGQPPVEGRFTLKDMGPLYLERYWNEKNFVAVDKFKQLAQRNGLTLPQFALAWILNNPGITAVLSGSTSIKQLEENVKAVGVSIAAEDMQTC